MSVYDRIKEVCDSKNIAISTLESAAGISNGSISKWKTQMPKADNLQSVASVLEVSSEYLLGKTDNPVVVPSELNSAQVAFNGENGEGLDADDIEMLVDLANRLRKKP